VRNWAGPIGDFELIVDSATPVRRDACIGSVRRVSAQRAAARRFRAGASCRGFIGLPQDDGPAPRRRVARAHGADLAALSRAQLRMMRNEITRGRHDLPQRARAPRSPGRGTSA
jgi:hypothetical protein